MNGLLESGKTRCTFGMVVLLSGLLALGVAEQTMAKSVYVIADIHASPTPIHAYDIQPDGTLVYQATISVPAYSGGGVGLALDSDSDTLFVTYEFTNIIQLVDAVTFADLGTTTAPGAGNLAGIVYDHERDLLYAVDRHTDDLFVYSWDSVGKVLTLQAQPDLTGAAAIGIALDEDDDLLYVASGDTTIQYFNTADWTPAGSFSVTGPAVGIAVDVAGGFVYSGAGWSGYEYLSQYDLTDASEVTVHLGNGVGVMGVSVNPETGLVYVSTGYSGDDLQVLDSQLNVVDNTGAIGNPTGVAIGYSSFSPFNLTKDDGLGEDACARAGRQITYSVCYDNEQNPDRDAHNVTLVDTLPPEVSFVSATDGGTYDAITHTVTWDKGTVVGGAPKECVQLVGSISSGTPVGTTIINWATIDSDETQPATETVVTPICEVLTMPRVDASKKGSVLIYPKVEIKWDAAGNVTQDTFITILNDYPEDVFVHWYFVNGDEPLDEVWAGDPPALIERAHPGWNWMNYTTHLTQNEPTYFSALTGLPAGCQPFTALDDEGGVLGRLDSEAADGSRVMRGYMLVYAVDNFGNEISWNHLSGSATLVHYADQAAWEYNAYAFQATAELGEWTDDTPGELHLDAIEYNILFDRLLLDFYAVGSQAFSGGGSSVMLDTDLTLMPVMLDLRQDSEGPVTTKAHFDIWNENEDSFSGTTRCITCWDQTFLSAYGMPNYFGGNLQTDKGKARIDGMESTMCEDSVNAPLLGVSWKILAFSGATTARASAGMTLVGQGEEAGFILTDIIAPPDTLVDGPDSDSVGRTLRTMWAPRGK